MFFFFFFGLNIQLPISVCSCSICIPKEGLFKTNLMRDQGLLFYFPTSVPNHKSNQEANLNVILSYTHSGICTCFSVSFFLFALLGEDSFLKVVKEAWGIEPLRVWYLQTVLEQKPSGLMKCLHYHYSVSSFSPTSHGKRKKKKSFLRGVFTSLIYLALLYMFSFK